VYLKDVHALLIGNHVLHSQGSVVSLSFSNVQDLVSPLRGYMASSAPVKGTGAPRVYGWVHVACMGHGPLIAAEMHGRMEQSGLLDLADRVFVSMLGDGMARGALEDALYSRHGDKYRVVHSGPDLTEYEWPALRHMWDTSFQEDFHGFYVHTKGASNCRPDVIPRIQRNIRNWRYAMSRAVIAGHETCRGLLSSGVDACGPLHYPHFGGEGKGIFAGNFWWARSEHIRRLPSAHMAALPGGNRMGAETWVCSSPGGLYKDLLWTETADPYDFAGVFGEGGPLAAGRLRGCI
jgi:hypothetical protein